MSQIVGAVVGDVSGVGPDIVTLLAATLAIAIALSQQIIRLSPDELARAPSLGWAAMCFPLMITAVGIGASAVTFLLATVIATPWNVRYLNQSFAVQQLISTLMLYFLEIAMAFAVLPVDNTLMDMSGSTRNLTRMHAAACAIVGTLGTFFIGRFCEYYSSSETNPVSLLTQSTTLGGAALSLLKGTGLGCEATIVPVILLGIVVYVAYLIGDCFGLVLALVGMLANTVTLFATDTFAGMVRCVAGIHAISRSARDEQPGGVSYHKCFILVHIIT
jgi:Na+/H+-translocating membrane pyrophosphatase